MLGSGAGCGGGLCGRVLGSEVSRWGTGQLWWWGCAAGHLKLAGVPHSSQLLQATGGPQSSELLWAAGVPHSSQTPWLVGGL